MKKYILFRMLIVVLCAGSSLAINAQTQQQEIKIADFQVVKNENRVDVKWTTDKNVSANYFELERSNDGKNFKTIAYILGADPSKQECECYGCFDKITAVNKQSYYRIKHVKLNGEVEFSSIKMLAINN